MLDERACYEAMLACLPLAVRRELAAIERGRADLFATLSEIRLRAGRVSSLTVGGKNLPLAARVTASDTENALRLFCRDSVYAYSETLCEGYLRLQGGYRVGVAGVAVREGRRVVGVRAVSALCIRVPHRIAGAGRVALETFRSMGCTQGLLIYAPPGVGKTTLLRDLAVMLSEGREALRVAVVDTRGELCGTEGICGMIDVLEDYPKALGIEIATRTLSPQAVICDEIGDYDEADSILAVQSSGVPLIASAHGDSLEGVLMRPAISLLDRAGVFGAYIGIQRKKGVYSYTVTRKKDTKDAPCACAVP